MVTNKRRHGVQKPNQQHYNIRIRRSEQILYKINCKDKNKTEKLVQIRE